jgi:hypothetical protein
MAYLVKNDLTSHIYGEIITAIIRDYSTSYANLAAFPAIGLTGRKYVATNTTKTYIWNGDAYEEITPFDLVAESIAAAISEVKSYLSRYNRTKLFDPAATGFVDDRHLKSKVKDLACWHLVKLANPNKDVAMLRTAYEDAKAWLKDVQSGKADPEGWPYNDDDSTSDFNENNAVQYTTNTKRNQHY